MQLKYIWWKWNELKWMHSKYVQRANSSKSLLRHRTRKGQQSAIVLRGRDSMKSIQMWIMFSDATVLNGMHTLTQSFTCILHSIAYNRIVCDSQKLAFFRYGTSFNILHPARLSNVPLCFSSFLFFFLFRFRKYTRRSRVHIIY